MKKYIKYPITILLAIAIVSCATFSVNAYKTISGVALVVDTARKAYNVLYNEGKITPELDAKVSKVYADYQVAAREAVQAVQTYDSLVVAKASPSMDNVNAAITKLSLIVNDLLSLFNRAGVPSVKPFIVTGKL